MMTRARGLLPSIQKLEKLLGHNLNITRSTLEERVQATVKRQINEFGLQILSLNYSKVDWEKMTLDASYRRPPFASGDKEKGFRDALVVESFLQLHSVSAATPRICRVILVSADHFIAEAVRARTGDARNVQVLNSVDELKGFINTLVSEVTEDFVATLQPLASSYFFENQRRDCLYYKENLREKILAKFGEKLGEVPPGTDYRENGKWFVEEPRFVNKKLQRVTWVTRIEVDSKASKSLATSNPYTIPLEGSAGTGIITAPPPGPSDIYFGPGDSTLFSQTPGTGGYALAGGPAPFTSYLSSMGSTRNFRFLIATGKSLFEVTWSISVSTRWRLSAPRIESISYLDTIWE